MITFSLILAWHVLHTRMKHLNTYSHKHMNPYSHGRCTWHTRIKICHTRMVLREYILAWTHDSTYSHNFFIFAWNCKTQYSHENLFNHTRMVKKLIILAWSNLNPILAWSGLKKTKSNGFRHWWLTKVRNDYTSSKLESYVQF